MGDGRREWKSEKGWVVSAFCCSLSNEFGNQLSNLKGFIKVFHYEKGEVAKGFPQNNCLSTDSINTVYTAPRQDTFVFCHASCFRSIIDQVRFKCPMLYVLFYLGRSSIESDCFVVRFVLRKNTYTQNLQQFGKTSLRYIGLLRGANRALSLGTTPE